MGKDFFAKNHDYTEDDSGWLDIVNFKSVKEYLDSKKKKEEKSNKVARRMALLYCFTKSDQNNIDFPLEHQIKDPVLFKEPAPLSGVYDHGLTDKDKEDVPYKKNIVDEEDIKPTEPGLFGMPQGTELEQDELTDSKNPFYSEQEEYSGTYDKLIV